MSVLNQCVVRLSRVSGRGFSTCSVMAQVQAGRYKTTINRDRPLTYEMSRKPHHIAREKAWLSWNTSNLLDGSRSPECAAEDAFIRKFMYGTWHQVFVSEVQIKRRHNLIVLSGVIQRNVMARKIYFLTGYTEELLAGILKCVVRVELQSVERKEDVVYKYI